MRADGRYFVEVRPRSKMGLSWSLTSVAIGTYDGRREDLREHRERPEGEATEGGAGPIVEPRLGMPCGNGARALDGEGCRAARTALVGPEGPRSCPDRAFSTTRGPRAGTPLDGELR